MHNKTGTSHTETFIAVECRYYQYYYIIQGEKVDVIKFNAPIFLIMEMPQSFGMFPYCLITIQHMMHLLILEPYSFLFYPHCKCTITYQITNRLNVYMQLYYVVAILCRGLNFVLFFLDDCRRLRCIQFCDTYRYTENTLNSCMYIASAHVVLPGKATRLV